jgi:hypothetical protein
VRKERQHQRREDQARADVLDARRHRARSRRAQWAGVAGTLLIAGGSLEILRNRIAEGVFGRSFSQRPPRAREAG